MSERAELIHLCLAKRLTNYNCAELAPLLKSPSHALERILESGNVFLTPLAGTRSVVHRDYSDNAIVAHDGPKHLRFDAVRVDQRARRSGISR